MTITSTGPLTVLIISTISSLSDLHGTSLNYTTFHLLTPSKYRHVILPKSIARTLKKDTLMSEEEWRGIGVQQSRGWIHYMVHRPGEHLY